MAADATAKFSIELSADTSSSDALADSLTQLKAKIQADQKEVMELQKALKNLQSGTSVNIEEARALQSQLDAAKASLAANQQAYIELGGSVSQANAVVEEHKAAQEAAAKAAEDSAKAAAEAQKKQMEEIKALQEENLKRHQQDADAAVKIEAEKAKEAEKAAKEQEKLFKEQETASKEQLAYQKELASGLAAIAAVYVAVVAVIAAAAAALFRFGVMAANAARSAAILRASATGSAQAGKELGAAVDELAKKLAMPREELSQLALSLARSGLSGLALKNALSAIATASTVMGAAAGSALEGIIERSRIAKRFLVNALDLKGTGLALQDVGAALAKKLGISIQAALAALQNGQIKFEDGVAALNEAVLSKHGSAAAKLGMGLNVQIGRLKDNFAKLFEGVNIEPLLKGLSKIVALFDETSTTGKALKAIIEKIFNPLMEAVDTYSPQIKAFFQGMIIGALTFAIYVLKIRNWLREAFGGKEILSLNTAMMAGIGIFGAFIGILIGIAAVMALVAFSVFLVALPFLLVAAAIYFAVQGVMWLVNAISQLSANLGSIDLGSIASNIVNSFVSTLMSAGGLVAAAAKNLASNALNAIKGVLGIASPSKEMIKLAGFTAEGFASGIEDGTEDVQGAMSAMVKPPSAALDLDKEGAGGGGGGVVKGGVVISGDVYIGSKKELADEGTKQSVIELFELAAAHAGLLPGGALA